MAPSEIHSDIDRWEEEADGSIKLDKNLRDDNNNSLTGFQDNPNHEAPESAAVANDKRSADADLPEFLKKLREAENMPANFDVSQDIKPSWFDEAKFKRGQKFAMEHFFCVNLSETLALLLSFAIKPSLVPFIFTEKTTSPFTASRRYLNTGLKLISWYTDDPFEKNGECYKNIRSVRNLHRSIRDQLSKASAQELKNCSNISSDCREIWSDAQSIDMLQNEFRASCPFRPVSDNSNLDNREWCNQVDLVDAQFAFVGLAMTFPKRFGMHTATKEDLDDFIHLWRVIGYLMGIRDEYNFCSEGIDGVQKRTHDYLEFKMKPALREVDETWEHMSRCFVAGIAFYAPGVHFESILKYLCTIIDIPIPKFTKKMTFAQLFFYYFVRFTFDIVLRVMPSLLPAYNKYALSCIKYAVDASSEKLEKWKTTEFPYMKKG